MPEKIQVKTDMDTFETICTVSKFNNMIMSWGWSRKATDIINALRLAYPKDEFRVLNTDKE